MPDPIPLSASGLRQVMRDPRYWRSGHPERADYHAWVTDAWQQLHAAESQPNSDGLVWVNPYTRTRDGETEEVSGHYRHAGGSSGSDATSGEGAGAIVAVEDQPSHDVERRYTARDASGGLIGSCERLTDDSQICTLALPDGGVVVQQLQPGDGEFTPVAAPAFAAAYGFPLLLGAATSFYTYLQSQLQAVPGGNVASDTPFMLFYRGFEGTQADVRVTVGSLQNDRVNEFCPKTAEFEGRLAEIAGATSREGLSPQQWGTAVHTAMRDDIRRRYGPTSAIVSAEFSVLGGREDRYGALGTTRLDIYHRVEGTSTICAYDIKTGQAALNSGQAARIYREAHDFAQQNGIANPRVLIIELHQTR
jgi:hypothetical protein